jgi:hypothetical protein
MTTPPRLSEDCHEPAPIDETDDRHLTPEQCDDISASLQDSAKGPVSMSAAAADSEAVCYQSEIAEVLEDSGFDVEIDNSSQTPSGEESPPGLHASIADATIRPSHAFRVIQAFRRVGLGVATRINAKRRRKNALYIDVGSNDTPPGAPGISAWQAKAMKAVIAKWKAKFSTGLRRPSQDD